MLPSEQAGAELYQVHSETAALPTGPALDESGVPAVLGARDQLLYRQIFTLQKSGNWKPADELIAELGDRLLLGHVLAQRYLHPTKWRSSYAELSDWLAAHADHPQAPRLHRLALTRRPAGAAEPPAPKVSRAALTGGTPLGLPVYRSQKQLSEAQQTAARALQKHFSDHIRKGDLDAAERLLGGAKARELFDRVERDQRRARIAAVWLYRGTPETALSLAEAAAERSDGQVPLAHWIAGLAAWKLEDLTRAAGHFEAAADADLASGWTRAAGAYWAARSHLRLRQPAEMSAWLARAAKQPRTFYGLLARRALGMPLGFGFDHYPLSRSQLTKLLGSTEGRRGAALLQIGQHDRAVGELLRLGNWDRATMAQALLALADRANLPALSFKLGTRLAQVGAAEDLVHSALFPLPKWQPETGFEVDRALIFALVRQESAFDPDARNPSGASGLLQIMPKTAEYIAGGPLEGKDALLDPGVNLKLGQDYLAYLLDNAEVKGDLFKLAAAYNGGPGNLERWSRRMGESDDPLLFIESLPSRETRKFIQRVLTNLWIYRERLGQDTPSLDEIAAGEWPRYTALDE